MNREMVRYYYSQRLGPYGRTDCKIRIQPALSGCTWNSYECSPSKCVC